MNKLKSLKDKAIKKIKKDTKKEDFKISVKLINLTVKQSEGSDAFGDLMYRLEWKRGPDVFASRLIDIKAGADKPEKPVIEEFSKISSFHTKEMDQEISKINT